MQKIIARLWNKQVGVDLEASKQSLAEIIKAVCDLAQSEYNYSRWNMDAAGSREPRDSHTALRVSPADANTQSLLAAQVVIHLNCKLYFYSDAMQSSPTLFNRIHSITHCQIEFASFLFLKQVKNQVLHA